MSLESQVADLTTATTALLDAVTVQKATLDDAVADATTQATAAGTSATGAAAAQTAAEAAAAAASAAGTGIDTVATSTTSISFGIGSKAFTLAQTGKDFAIGMDVVVAKQGDPQSRMIGTVTAFADPAITIQTKSNSGSGTNAAWTLSQAAAGDAGMLGMVGTDSIRIGLQFGSMDSTVQGSLLFDGRSAFPNKIGVNNTKPVTNPTWFARANDAAYVAGDASEAGVLAGYDNINNALAGMICSQHAIIYAGATHAAIFGGSLHSILAGSDYSGIFGGTDHKIEADCDYGVIAGGERNVLLAGGTTATSGHRGAILGGFNNIVSGQYGAAISGRQNTVSVTYGTCLNGELCTVSGNHGIASGNTVAVSGAFSAGYGNVVTISGSRSWGFGDTITSAFDYCMAFGFRVISPFEGSRVFSARQRGNNAGYNQSLQFECSQETTDTTLTSLSVSGSSGYPKCPDQSAVVGTFWINAVDDAGNISAWKIDFGCKKNAAGSTPAQGGAPVVTALYDNIGVAAAPAINFTTDIFRVRVSGKAATNIRWMANFVGNVMKWT